MFQLVRDRSRLFAVLSAVLVLILLSGTTALAASWATSAAKPQKLKVVASDTIQQTSSQQWQNISGMSLTMSVPRGQAIFLVTLSGVTSCHSTGSANGNCQVRVLVNEQAAHPGEVTFSVELDASSQDAGANSMQFVTDPLPAGSYEITAQMRDLYGTGYEFFGRTMTVLRAKV